MSRHALVLFAATLAVPACFATELDPDATNAFACDARAVDSECPGDQVCSAGRCRAEQDLPIVVINDPSDGFAQPFVATDGAPMTTVQFTISGPHSLVNPDDNPDHVFGEGHAAVFVDGEKVAKIMNDDASGGREVPVTIPNRVGAHRIAVVFFRNDNEPYDHPGARAGGLYWLDDGTPRVAVTSPWPGDVFGLESRAIDVEVGVINFEIANSGGPAALRMGHAHVHYNDPFPDCPTSSECDPGYIVIADAPRDGDARFATPNSASVANLPEEPAPRQSEITAILRHVDHSPYRLPDMGDDTFQFPPAEGEFVFDTITIERR